MCKLVLGTFLEILALCTILFVFTKKVQAILLDGCFLKNMPLTNYVWNESFDPLKLFDLGVIASNVRLKLFLATRKS